MVQKNSAKISRMFSEIASSYDLLNRILSGGIDRYWRKLGARKLAPKNGLFLDLASGTCDFSLELRKQDGTSPIVAADFSQAMLEIARKKTAGKNIKIVRGDALSLGFRDNSFAGITCAFGIRNFEKLETGLKEILRVLKPGGRTVILEFTTPENSIIKAVYLFYFTRILPIIGRLISGHSEAYTYLPLSAVNFPNRKNLAEIFQSSGFINITVTPLTFGICDLIYAEKPG